MTTTMRMIIIPVVNRWEYGDFKIKILIRKIRSPLMVNEKSSCEFRDRKFPDGTDIGAHGRLCECVDGKWVPVVLVSGI